jgi:hypothetical protein
MILTPERQDELIAMRQETLRAMALKINSSNEPFSGQAPDATALTQTGEPSSNSSGAVSIVERYRPMRQMAQW